MKESDILTLEKTLGGSLGISPDSAADGFGHPPDIDTIDIPEFEIKQVESKFSDVESDITSDYIYSRNMLYTLMDMTSKALNTALHVAMAEKTARSFEAFNAIANTMRETTKEMLGLQKMTKEIVKDKPEFETPKVETNNTQTNNFFPDGGPKSTAEIIEMFEKKRADEIELTEE